MFGKKEGRESRSKKLRKEGKKEVMNKMKENEIRKKGRK